MKKFRVVFRRRAGRINVRISEVWEQNPAFASTKDLYKKAQEYASKNGWELVAIEEKA